MNGNDEDGGDLFAAEEVDSERERAVGIGGGTEAREVCACRWWWWWWW